jgi:NADH-quinone oxidoreductase subunit L
MSHAVFKAALFLMAGVLIHSAHSKYINEMGGMKDRLKLTFAVFLIAVASLSGIPPLSGFWAKDAVLGIAWSSGQFGLFIVGSLTAGITAFYAFRMLGIVFFGQKSSHLTEVEAGGHPVHEAGPLSWVPYTILASGTVVLGILGFFDIEGFLDSAANTYLRSLLPSGSGLLIASQLYFLRQGSADRIVASSAFLRGLHTFLENRWYINAVYYKVFVDAPLAAATWTHIHFEWGVLQRVNTGAEALAKDLSAGGGWLDTSVIDRLANRIADAGQAVSRTARKIQTGIVENYALVLILGLLVMLLLFILLTGLYTSV